MGNRKPGRSRAKRHDQIWVPAVTAGSVLASGVATENILVAGTDWADASTGLERATSMGIRGWVAMTSDFTANGIVTFLATIGVYGELSTVTGTSLTSLTPYIEDLFWTAGYLQKDNAVASEAPRIQNVWEVNIRTRRRFTDQDKISLVTQSNGTAGRLSFVLRTLVRRD